MKSLATLSFSFLVCLVEITYRHLEPTQRSDERVSSVQQKAETRQSPVLLPPTLPTNASSTALAVTKPQNPPISPNVASATGRESEAETLALDKNSQPQVRCWDCHCTRQTRAASVPELQTPCSGNTHPKTLREARLSGTAPPTPHPPGCRDTEGAAGGLRVVGKLHPVGTRRGTGPCASSQAPALSLVLQSGQAVPGLLLIPPPCQVWLREKDGWGSLLWKAAQSHRSVSRPKPATYSLGIWAAGLAMSLGFLTSETGGIKCVSLGCDKESAR